MLDRVGVYGRNALHTDAVEAQFIRGGWLSPKAGDSITLPDGSVHAWTAASAGEDGWLNHQALGGGYALFTVHSDADRVMLLSCRGNNLVFVNGEPRTGDPYNLGITRLPVALKAGDNQFLFHCSRGQVWARLNAMTSPVMILDSDSTLPDVVAGQPVDSLGAVIICNGQNQPLDGAMLAANFPGLPPTDMDVPSVPPMSIRKAAFRVQSPPVAAAPPEGPTKVDVRLELKRKTESVAPLDAAALSLAIVQPGQMQRRTFVSAIDGSVQYYAIRPANPPSGEASPPGVILSLHGASVEASNQAAAYAPKPWAHIVAPTNRRPFGFDWEDWGRLDAIEVLDLAQRTLGADLLHTWLTGHSMGGHGTWQVGATFPDRFAAIAPSAGWISFWSYAGATKPEHPTPVQDMLLRAANPSDTLALSRNYLQHGVYILHGDADDNVPVDQARAMRQHLAQYHPDFAYKEQPGAGHWWGDACVDWPPMMEFLQHHALAADGAVNHVEFFTASPGVSAKCHWATIEAQIRPLAISSINLNRDPAARAVSGSTDNVARLAIALPGLEAGKPLTIELDGRKLENVPWPAEGDVIRLAREADNWTVAAAAPSPALKGPHRNGLFKDAFRNRVILVYGTKGSPEENTWAFNKARFDAETFWYRGNGSMDVIPDTAFNPAAEPDRNVVLYGNADTNAAWAALLAESPVQAHRGSIRIGDHEIPGDDLACLFIRPRLGSAIASVGAVTGTGLVGLRLTDRMPYFISGVAYPDCIVLGADSLVAASEGVRAAGFFGNDWSMNGGDFVWQEKKTPGS